MDIGRRLRELRLARGLSETDLETRTGIPSGHLAAVEDGQEKPTFDSLEAWARGLGVEMHELFVAKPGRTGQQQDITGTLTVQEKKVIRLVRSLSPADQRDILFVGRKMAVDSPEKQRG